MKLGSRFSKFFLFGILAVGSLAYTLDRGIYVGSDNVILGMPCCPGLDTIEKECRYLFVTGISKIYPRESRVTIRDVLSSEMEKLRGLGVTEAEIENWAEHEKRKGAQTLLDRSPEFDNGYCRLFAK